jgi:hypothetical protein
MENLRKSNQLFPGVVKTLPNYCLPRTIPVLALEWVPVRFWHCRCKLAFTFSASSVRITRSSRTSSASGTGTASRIGNVRSTGNSSTHSEGNGGLDSNRPSFYAILCLQLEYRHLNISEKRYRYRYRYVTVKSRRKCQHKATAANPVLRIRIWDPVLFYPLDPGLIYSGSRISDLLTTSKTTGKTLLLKVCIPLFM